jgi:hypothetical protein
MILSLCMCSDICTTDDSICLDEVISSDVRQYACNKSRKPGWIIMTFFMDIIPVEACQKSYFLISYFGNINVMDAKNFLYFLIPM